jgi:hypothetical protein
VKLRSCYYVIESDGTFWLLPKKTFARILEPLHSERHAEFAGQRVRYAQIDVAYEGNDPVRIARASFHSLKFDEAGQLDDEDVFKQQELMLQRLAEPADYYEAGGASARAERADQELDLRFGWAPTAELRERLFAAALGRKRSGGAPN